MTRPPKNAATVYLSSWAEGSDTYTTNYKSLAAIADVLDGDDPQAFDWGSLRYDDVRALPVKLTQRPVKKGDPPLKPNTVNKALSALRGVLEAAYRLGQLPESEYRLIKVKNVRGKALPAGRALSAEEMDAVAAALEKSTPHDAALVAVLAGAGLRRVEAARLCKKDYDAEAGEVSAYGKGNKARSIPVGARWRSVIETWWSTREEGSKLFDLPGKDPRRRVSYVVECFWQKNALREFTPHDLRRTFGTFIEQHGGIALAQELLGHESMQTTGLYVRVNKERRRAAVEGL